MDPDALLEEIMLISRSGLHKVPDVEAARLGRSLASKINSLVDWLGSGGALPKAFMGPPGAVRTIPGPVPELAWGESVGGQSRKLTREWGRIQPGLEGQLIAVGGEDEDSAYAWIDVRPEK